MLRHAAAVGQGIGFRVIVDASLCFYTYVALWCGFAADDLRSGYAEPDVCLPAVFFFLTCRLVGVVA